MPRELFRNACIRAWEEARGLLVDEEGQQIAEYSSLMFYMMLSSVGLFYFIPDSINAYKVYIRGFYFILGLPIP